MPSTIYERCHGQLEEGRWVVRDHARNLNATLEGAQESAEAYIAELAEESHLWDDSGDYHFEDTIVWREEPVYWRIGRDHWMEYGLQWTAKYCTVGDREIVSAIVLLPKTLGD